MDYRLGVGVFILRNRDSSMSIVLLWLLFICRHVVLVIRSQYDVENLHRESQVTFTYYDFMEVDK